MSSTERGVQLIHANRVLARLQSQEKSWDLDPGGNFSRPEPNPLWADPDYKAWKKVTEWLDTP